MGIDKQEEHRTRPQVGGLGYRYEMGWKLDGDLSFLDINGSTGSKMVLECFFVDTHCLYVTCFGHADFYQIGRN